MSLQGPVGWITLALAVLLPLDAVRASSPSAEPRSFAAEMGRAMETMDTGMMGKPTGDVDRDFVAMMVPHHQGAIDMAVAELRYGHDEQLRRIAQEIIVDQQQEIAAMRLAVGQPLPSSAPAPTHPAAPVAGGAVATASLPISHRDRVYAAEQFSNTVSVTDPVDNTLLGVIRLGDPQPGNFSPLYHGQVLVHGLGFSPDHRTLVVVSIGSNSVTFIDTATNEVKHTTYLGRSPHEAFFTPDGREVWVSVRGEDYLSVIDPRSYQETARIKTPGGPGMTIFSPDGRYGYVCSSFNPVTLIVSVADRKVVGQVVQPSPFCPNIAASPDGEQVWFTLKDTGKAVAFSAKPPFALLKTLETGPLTNHVNIVRNAHGQFAYVTVGGLNQVQVYRTRDFTRVAVIAVGKMPHGIWPSGDGTRVYVGLENDDALAVIDTSTNKVIASVPVGQAPQAVVYLPDAVPSSGGTQNLQPLGIAGEAAHRVLVVPGRHDSPPSSVSLFEQGLVQVLQAAVTGLAPKRPYVLALSARADGSGVLEPLASFQTNPAGAAIVNSVGPIRQLVTVPKGATSPRKYLVIASGSAAAVGPVVQIEQIQ